MGGGILECSAEVVRACGVAASAAAGAGGTGASWIREVVPFVQAFGPALSLVAIVIGWMYVSGDNDKRECRKETRALLNDIRDLTLTIENLACDYYHKSPTESGRLGMDIKRELNHLAVLIATLKTRKKEFDCDNLLQAFRMAVTGHDFDSAGRQPRASDNSLFMEISTASLALTTHVEKVFSSLYAK